MSCFTIQGDCNLIEEINLRKGAYPQEGDKWGLQIKVLFSKRALNFNVQFEVFAILRWQFPASAYPRMVFPSCKIFL